MSVLAPEYLNVSVDSGSRSYLFTSATVRIPVYPAPKYGTEGSVTLHSKARRGAASLRYRNQAAITVQKPLSGMAFVPAKAIRYRMNIALKYRVVWHTYELCIFLRFQ